MLHEDVVWGKIGGAQASESILTLLSKGGWYFTSEIEERFSQTPWIVLDQLIALQANDRLVSIRLPEKRQFLWHKATRVLIKATESRGDAGISDLPWLVRKQVAKKLRGRCPRSAPAGATTSWIRAAKRVERHMIVAGLQCIRARPDVGFDYKCAWHTAPYTESYLPGSNKFTFDVGFVGTSKTHLRRPAPRGNVYMRISESTGWLGSENCQYIVVTDVLGTRLWLSIVTQLTVDASTGQVTAPSTEELVEQTNRLILEGAERVSALVNFSQMFTSSIQLISGEQAALQETKPS